MCTGGRTKEKVREEITLATYIAWNIWKRKKPQGFSAQRVVAIALARLIKDEIKMFYEATRAVAARGT